MRAKLANETIWCIRREDSSIVEDDEEILTEVGNYYIEIFTKDPLIQANIKERRQVLSLISNKLTDLKRAILDREPTRDEVEAVVKTFKKGKLPGLNGLTAEVLQACWEWVGKRVLKLSGLLGETSSSCQGLYTELFVCSLKGVMGSS